MEFKFKENIESFMKILAKNALINNVRVFFVGGCVRDIFLGVPTKDVDFLVQGNALDFVNFFKDEVSVVYVHDDFATVKVLYKDIVFDIASSRVEHYPYSGCLPCVDEVGCDINIDVKRRDFTVYSIYVEFFKYIFIEL